MRSQEEVERRLQTKIWQTSGARFNASRRFHVRERLSIASIAGLAVVGIAISIAPSVIGVPTEAAQVGLYSFLGVAIGLSVLVTSLIEGGGKFSIRAEKLHDNARDLSALQNKMDLILVDPSHTTDQIEGVRTDYEKLVRECPFNHSPADHNRFVAQHRQGKEFLGKDGKPKLSWFKAACHVAFWHLHSTWVFLISWLLVLSILYALASAPFSPTGCD